MKLRNKRVNDKKDSGNTLKDGVEVLYMTESELTDKYFDNDFLKKRANKLTQENIKEFELKNEKLTKKLKIDIEKLTVSPFDVLIECAYSNDAEFVISQQKNKDNDGFCNIFGFSNGLGSDEEVAKESNENLEMFLEGIGLNYKKLKNDGYIQAGYIQPEEYMPKESKKPGMLTEGMPDPNYAQPGEYISRKYDSMPSKLKFKFKDGIVIEVLESDGKSREEIEKEVRKAHKEFSER